MKIRKAKRSDEKRVIELLREYDEYEYKLDKRHKPDSLKEVKRLFDILMKSKIGVGFVLEVNGDIEGFTSGEYRNTLMGKNCIFHQLIVSEKYRGKGYGEKLLKELEKYFRKKGCKNIQSFVLIKNKKVLKFYKRLKYSFNEEGFIIRKGLK